MMTSYAEEDLRMTQESHKNDGQKTRVLSADERRQFDGITIEDNAGHIEIDETPTYEQQGQDYENRYNQYTNPRVKVIRLGGSSWLSRIILIALLAAIVAAVIFFGGIIAIIIGAIMLIGAVISFIFGLF